MPTDGWSRLATRAAHPRDVTNRSTVWGITLHTTGSGVAREAKKDGIAPLEWAVAYYCDPDSYAAHYVIDHDGTVVQIANEWERMSHVGLDAAEREKYLSGAWEKVNPTTTALWEKAWPGYQSPSHLYPGKSVNAVYVGVELIPTTGTSAKPWKPGLTFTQFQHTACLHLCADVARRHSFPAGWGKTGRLVGHEDVNPLDRQDRGGGWDPGFLRAVPRFDFGWLRGAL